MRSGCYLIHFHGPGVFQRPRTVARHYLGWAKDIDRRFGEHQKGQGNVSPLVQAALARGNTLELARVWLDVDRHFERSLKNQKRGPRLCPICRRNA